MSYMHVTYMLDTCSLRVCVRGRFNFGSEHGRRTATEALCSREGRFLWAPCPCRAGAGLLMDTLALAGQTRCRPHPAARGVVVEPRHGHWAWKEDKGNLSPWNQGASSSFEQLEPVTCPQFLTLNPNFLPVSHPKPNASPNPHLDRSPCP